MRPKALVCIAAYLSNLPAAAASYLGPGLRVPLLVSFVAHVSANTHDSVFHHSNSRESSESVQHLGHLRDDYQQCAGERANSVQQKLDELKGLIDAVGGSIMALQDEVEKSTKPCAPRPDGPTPADETTIVGDFKRAFEKIVEDLEVWTPVLKETSRGPEEIVGVAMDKFGTTLAAVCKKYGMKEETARNHWDTLRPPIESAVVLLARQSVCDAGSGESARRSRTKFEYVSEFAAALEPTGRYVFLRVALHFWVAAVHEAFRIFEAVFGWLLQVLAILVFLVNQVLR